MKEFTRQTMEVKGRMSEQNPTRRAKITQAVPPELKEIEAFMDRVRALLPDNYKVGYNNLTEQFMISGHDVAGWTLDEYVIPRLASGLIFAEEVK